MSITIYLRKTSKGWTMEKIKMFRSTTWFKIPNDFKDTKLHPVSIQDFIKKKLNQTKSINNLTVNILKLDDNTRSFYLDHDDHFKIDNIPLEKYSVPLIENKRYKKYQADQLEKKLHKLKFNHLYDEITIFIDELCEILEEYDLSDDDKKMKLINYCKYDDKQSFYELAVDNSFEDLLIKFKERYEFNNSIHKINLSNMKLSYSNVEEYVKAKYQLAKMELLNSRSAASTIDYMINRIFDEETRSYLDRKIKFKELNSIIYLIKGKLYDQMVNALTEQSSSGSDSDSYSDSDNNQSIEKLMNKVGKELNRPDF